MKNIFLMTLFLYISPNLMAEVPRIKAGQDHLCLFTPEYMGRELQCYWVGDDSQYSYGQENIGSLDLTRPIDYALGAEHTCVLDTKGSKNRVTCVGKNISGQLDVPPLENPSKIVAFENITCAQDQKGVKCWGGYNLNIEKCKNDEGYINGCFDRIVAMTGGGGLCFKTVDSVNFTRIVCFNQNEGVQSVDLESWESSVETFTKSGEFIYRVGEYGTVDVHHMFGTDYFYVGSGAKISSYDNYQVCFLSMNRNSVHCNTTTQTTVANSSYDFQALRYPTDIAVGDGFACVLDDEGIKCRGRGFDY